MTIFLWITFFFGIAVILYAVVLALRSLFRATPPSVAANLAISRAQILIERQQIEEKKALAKKAREASKVLSPLHFPPLQPWQLYRRIPKGQDPLASLSQEQKDAWLKDLVRKTCAQPIEADREEPSSAGHKNPVRREHPLSIEFERRAQRLADSLLDGPSNPYIDPPEPPGSGFC